MPSSTSNLRSLPNRLNVAKASELLEAMSFDELDLIVNEIAAVLNASDKGSNVIAVNFRQAHDEGGKMLCLVGEPIRPRR